MTTAQAFLGVKFNLENTSYKAIENIGTGAYGVVCKAFNQTQAIKKLQKTGIQIAIKKISQVFSVAILMKRSLREIRILRNLCHENIVSVHDVFATPGLHGLDVYMVLDLMETDLHRIIHSRQHLTDQHYQYFFYQIIRGLKYLHSAGIVHRDLKPSNVLVNSDCLLKIGDFGMARSVEQLNDLFTENYMSQYVSTRWYRAPELLFSLIDYDTKVDIWSAGCILAEMLLRRQLFPGKDAASQVKMIIYYLGTPEKAFMERISSELIIRWIESSGTRDPLPWSTIIPKTNPQALDLLNSLLVIPPWNRSTAEKALSHPYLQIYHDAENEANYSKKVYCDVTGIEKLSIDQLEQALLAEASQTVFHTPSNR
ncbi:unnamed protein product [Thelazia callipaeda]|uniref:Mitogen-activated protein kinase n=1 Tax=Thelazia callipaeda TaxID=103827 RepID=A0A0N5CJZ4_THECL|nr:unnamed protein product [Thelazia callipaeda]